MQLLILKGGPGSGKSTLMKRVAEYALKNGHVVETVPCASDVRSFDAVIDKTANFAMIDGTAPHTEDPGIPGAKHHIMYTGDLWDTDKLKKKTEEIEFYSNLTTQFHEESRAYIKAAGALLRENIRISSKYILDGAKEFAFELMTSLKDGDEYKESKRLLTAVTADKISFFKDTVNLLADEVYIIEDEWGGASNEIFETVKTLARLKNMEIIVCPCSVMPDKTDHIIFPGAGVALTKKNRFFGCEEGRTINADAFYRKGINKASSEKRCQDAERLLGRASGFIRAAKKTHDSLEKFYIAAMNFDHMDGLFEKIVADFYR